MLVPAVALWAPPAETAASAAATCVLKELHAKIYLYSSYSACMGHDATVLLDMVSDSAGRRNALRMHLPLPWSAEAACNLYSYF